MVIISSGFYARPAAAPHATFGISDNTRYTSNVMGIIVAAQEHFGALIRAGCSKA